MKLRRATPELVSQRVHKVLQGRNGGAPVVAVRAEPTWDTGALTVAQRRVQVQPCPSPLAVREALARWDDGDVPDGGAGDVLVLLCDLTDRDLGDDILARLSPPRVLSLEPWDAAKALFGVQRVDAAFGRDDGWIASALLEHVPEDHAHDLALGSTLTVEAALTALARVLLGADSISIDDLIEAAAHRQPFLSLADLTGDTRDGLLAQVADRNGPLGAVVAATLTAGHGADLLAIGVAARAVYGDGRHDGGAAAGRLEARAGGRPIDPSVGAALAQRCEEAVDRLLADDRDRANDVIAAAAAIAAAIDAPYPEASRLLPSGFDRRITHAVDALASILDHIEDPEIAPTATGDFDRLRDALDRAADHRERHGPAGARRLAQLQMAARLTAWLATPTAELPTPTTSGATGVTGPASFSQAVLAYAADGVWVDRARRRLWRGDDDGDIAAAYRRIIDRVVARRRDQNRRFADLLAAWSATPSTPATLLADAVTTVESVADTVLARLDLPLLFVVLDGCALASFAELAEQFRDLGFREIAPAATSGDGTLARRLTGIAALPTVTEVSRASLLAGTLDRGNQDHERRAFARITVLARDGQAPQLFHHQHLAGAAGQSLAADVTRALGPDGPGVVGVVINTIDDQLKRGTFTDELRLQDLHAFVSLLEAARTYGRAVVLSADHGHVLAQPDDGGTGAFAGGGEGGERWRAADRPPAETEVLLTGPRVLLGGDAGVLAPWEDDYRYGAKAGGYHGGATPEEVLVPVAAYLPAGMDLPAGWEPVTVAPPLWWDVVAREPATAVSREPAKAKTTRRPSKQVDQGQTTMFDLPDDRAAAPASRAAPPASELPWVAVLLESDIWAAQRKTAGRAPLPDERVRAVLVAASFRGGVASFAELSVATGLVAARLNGFLAQLARALNVDGYPVLDVDVTAQEIRLSLATLAQQFAVDVEGL